MRKDLADVTKQLESESSNYKTIIAKEKSTSMRTIEESKTLVKTMKNELNEMRAKAKKFASIAKKMKEQCKVGI